jgi:parallel beta-helix repeat protein
VTLDGLVIDATGNTVPGYTHIEIDSSSATVRNTTLRGSGSTDTGILMNNDRTSILKLTVTRSDFLGYVHLGIEVLGPAKLNVSSSTFDATDNSRITTDFPHGIQFDGGTSDAIIPTGSVSKSMLRNNDVGVEIDESSNVTVSKNTMTNNFIGVEIFVRGSFLHHTKNNKVVSNTITGVLSGGAGVEVADDATDLTTFPLLNTQVTKNLIQSAAPDGFFGVLFLVSAPAAKTMTGTVTGNTLVNFAAGNAIVNENNFAGLKLKNNIVTP